MVVPSGGFPGSYSRVGSRGGGGRFISAGPTECMLRVDIRIGTEERSLP